MYNIRQNQEKYLKNINLIIFQIKNKLKCKFNLKNKYSPALSQVSNFLSESIFDHNFRHIIQLHAGMNKLFQVVSWKRGAKILRLESS
jgi:hypothetical protein